MISHKDKVLKISEQIKLARKLGVRPRVYRGSTNVTRELEFKAGEIIDIRDLGEILEINTKECWIEVEPNVSMKRLVEAVLPFGFVPPVVMEFPDISVGGGWQGGAGESSSFKYGLLHQCSIEVEAVDGDGSILNLSPGNQPEMYGGLACSYGSLAILTKIKLKLIPVLPFVELSYFPCDSFSGAVEIIKTFSLERSVDFIDCVVFSQNQGVVITGTFKNNCGENKPLTFSKTSDLWIYQFIKKKVKRQNFSKDYLPIEEYLFRYNRGAFWVGKYFFDFFKIPYNKLTQKIFGRWLNARDLYRSLHAANFSQHFFIQDFCLPVENAVDFLEYANNRLGMYPIWVCPILPSQSYDKLSPAYCKTNLVLNIGLYGVIQKGQDYLSINRDVEGYAKKCNARKTLYANSYYPKEEFWEMYDYDWYLKLREAFHADGIFPDIFEKTYVPKRYKGSLLKGFFTLIFRINPLKIKKSDV